MVHTSHTSAGQCVYEKATPVTILEVTTQTRAGTDCVWYEEDMYSSSTIATMEL